MESLLPLLGFAIATSATPGPNMLMVAASAANHGLRAVVPHVLGIAFGFAAMIWLTGMGLALPLMASPLLHQVVKWGGAAWLAWLAWKIASAGAPGQGPARPPLGFLGAVLFRWVNPKAWMIILAAIPAFTRPGEDLLPQISLIALVFAAVGVPSAGLWGVIGAGAGRLLRPGRGLRAFNIAMAVLMLASLIPALRQ